MNPLLEAVWRFFADSIEPPGPIVVAVSGGPDSVALCAALVALSEERGIGPITVAHLNHQLRGAESDADEAFVRSLPSLIGTAGASVTVTSECADVNGFARAQCLNLEDAARRMRYEFLTRSARVVGARFVATGHTVNDQAETVLHRLLRGTGLRGLTGIARRRPLGEGVELIRPVADVTRDEVLAFLGERHLPYRTDSSNRSVDRTRNRIRSELLPQLAREYNPAVVRALARLGDQAADAYLFVSEAAAQLLVRAERPRAGPAIVLDHAVLQTATPYLIAEAFRLVWTREGWPQGEMGQREWQSLVRLAAGHETACDLPGGVRAERRTSVVLLRATS